MLPMNYAMPSRDWLSNMATAQQLDAGIKRLDEARDRIREHWMAEPFDAERGMQYAAELERLTDEICALIRERDACGN